MKVSLPRVLTLCLCAAISGLPAVSISAQQVSGLSPEQAQREKVREIRLQQGAQAMVNMPSVAPLFIEDARFSSTLYIVNEGNPPAIGRLLLLTQDGHIIADKTVTIPGHDKTELAIKPLLEAANSSATRGSIELFDDNVEGSALAGELVITYQGESASVNLDEELLMPTMSQSPELRGLAIGAVANPVVSVSSTSDQPVQVKVSCTGERSKPTRVSFQVPSHQIVTIRPCSNSGGPMDALNAFNYLATEFGPPEARGIQILSSDPKAEIQAFGFSPIMTEGKLSFVPISFHDPADSISNQAVYPGVPVGYSGELWGTYQPRLAAQNYSATTRTISVYNARTVFGSSPSYGIVGKVQVQPLSVVTMDIDPGGNAINAMNTYVVEYDGLPGDLQTQLWSEDVQRTSPILFAGKDAKDDRNAGMHPWTTANGSQDDLILYDETETDQLVHLKVSNRQMIWAKTLTLSAHETRRISPRQLADTQATDDGKNAFTLGAGEGEISWYTDESGNVTGRLQHVDTQSHNVTSFQCAGYVVFCGIAPISGPSSVAVNQSATFSSGNPQSCVNNQAPQLCYGVYNGGYSVSEWQWSNYSPPLSLQSTNWASATFTGASTGSTYLIVTAIGSGSGCSFSQSQQVQVTPPQCFAQLKYRPVVVGQNHAFWWVQASNGLHYILDGGPTQNGFGCAIGACGNLDAWVSQGDAGIPPAYPEDNSGDNLAWQTGQSASFCSGVASMLDYTASWNNTQVTYYPLGPNSNTFAHLCGTAGGFSPTQPPNTPGW